ncbi:MAG: hypothetical protein ACU843_02960 [Gammaproteobacteria bacterium]
MQQVIWMNRLEYSDFLEKALGNQRATLGIHWALAIGVLALGIFGVAAVYVDAGDLIPFDQKRLLMLGGAFIAALSSLPIHQIANRRLKISALEWLSQGFAGLAGRDEAMTGEEAARLIERFWKLTDGSLTKSRFSMALQEKKFDQLLAQLETRERKSRRDGILWTLIPASAALVLLGYSSWRLQTSSEEIAGFERQAVIDQAKIRKLTTEINTRNSEIHQLESRATLLDAELRTTQQQLRDTLDLSKYKFPMDRINLKQLAGRYPQEGKILDTILQLRSKGVGWKLRGKSPEEGFDSPGFAEYILLRFERAPKIDDAETDVILASRKLFERLTPVSTPQTGDLVFYPAGYVMFFFADAENQSFVIGMTPAGITALQADFSQVLGYRRPWSQEERAQG